MVLLYYPLVLFGRNDGSDIQYGFELHAPKFRPSKIWLDLYFNGSLLDLHNSLRIRDGLDFSKSLRISNGLDLDDSLRIRDGIDPNN